MGSLTGSTLTAALHVCVSMGGTSPTYEPSTRPSVVNFKDDYSKVAGALPESGTGGLSVTTVEAQLIAVDSKLTIP